MNSPKIEMVEYILRGIDAIESADPEGWWETSTGANFGARKLEELRALFSQSPAPGPAKAMSDQQGLDTSSYSVPLYTHADSAEVERLRKACEAEFRSVETLNEDNQKLRAQLAEAQALLRQASKDALFGMTKVMIDDYLSASAEPSAPVERGPWQPLAAPGQVQDGDWLSFTVAGRFICAQARLVINPGTDKEEIVYNRQKNHYFVTSMAVDGSSTHKGVRVAKAKS